MAESRKPRQRQEADFGFDDPAGQGQLAAPQGKTRYRPQADSRASFPKRAAEVRLGMNAIGLTASSGPPLENPWRNLKCSHGG